MQKTEIKTLGIVGGAGAFATHHLYGVILDTFAQNGIFKDSDFPHILINNYPFKSTSFEGVQDELQIKEELNKALIPLNQCDKIIVACNTLHPFIEDERLISLPDLVLKKINHEKCLVICSRSSKNYHNFGNSPHIHYMSTNLAHQCDVVIQQKMNNQFVNESGFFACVHQEAAQIGATHIIVGCTELSMLEWSEFNASQTVIDPISLVSQFIYNNFTFI